MPAGNKDLMYLIANGAGGAKEQYGHATGAYAPRTPGKANHDNVVGESSQMKRIMELLSDGEVVSREQVEKALGVKKTQSADSS